MRIAVENFRGEIPRFAPRLLPDGYAISALNPRLLSGNLEAWLDYVQATTDAIAAPPINTIYLLADQYWLTWAQSVLGAGAAQVDVARSSIAADDNNRIFLTGLDMPRWTNVPLATTGGPPYPQATRPLGVVAPVNAPITAVQAGSSSLVNVTDDFTSQGSWTFSSGATIQSSGGNPGSRLQITASSPATANQYAYDQIDFLSSKLITFDADFRVDARDASSHWNLEFMLGTDSNGQGSRLALTYLSGGWQLATYQAVSWADAGAPSITETAVNPPDATWLHMSISMAQSSTTGWDATATITNGSSVLVSGTFPIQQAGDYWGFGVAPPGSGTVTASVDNFAFVGSATLPAVSVTDNFTQNNGWSFGGTGSSNTENHGGTSTFVAGATIGPNFAFSDGCLFLQTYNCARPVYARRDFAITGSASVEVDFDLQIHNTIAAPVVNGFNLALAINDSTGAGLGINLQQTSSSAGLLVQVGPTSAVGGWISVGSQVSFSAIHGISPDHTYRVKFSIAVGGSGASTVSVSIFDGSTQLDSVSLSGPAINGSFVNLMTWDGDDSRGWDVSIDNLSLVGSAPASATTQTATAYVFTFVNDQGEESAPSPASTTLLRNDGSTIAVTTDTVTPITALPADHNWYVTNKRIYRAASGAATTDYFFVAEIPLAQQTYLDGATDAQLPGDTLLSTDYDLPPSDLRGIVALPNGIYAGFSGNQFCLSEQGIPHAWPVKYRIGMDYPGVALGAVDSMCVIATEGKPYVANGTQPANYSMMRIEIPQGCIGPRSLAYLKGVGVVYASPDGLIAVAGPGMANIVTAAHFSKKEWQALNPASLIGSQYDDRYVAFYDTGTVKGGLQLELGQGGFGKQSLDSHASALFSDPLHDKLYGVLDYVATPSAGTPGGYTLPPTGKVVQFDGAATPMPFSWLSKMYLLEYPSTMRYCQVKADDYTLVVVSFFADGSATPFYTTTVANENAFVLPDGPNGVYATLEFQVSGTSAVRSIQIVDDVGELA